MAMQKIGLSLSGSGYRAAAFHLGVLKKFNDLGILPRIEVMSDDRGSCIAETFYYLNKNDFSCFESSLYQSLNEGSIRKDGNSPFSCKIIINNDNGFRSLPRDWRKNVFSRVVNTIYIYVFRRRERNRVRGQEMFERSVHGRQIVHLSPESYIENCIPAFIDNLRRKRIPPALMHAHHLHKDWIKNPIKYSDEIADFLREIIEYKNIPRPSAAELQVARTLPEGLSSLTILQIESLVKHAAALTELQLKLYCPGILN